MNCHELSSAGRFCPQLVTVIQKHRSIWRLLHGGRIQGAKWGSCKERLLRL